MLTPDVEQTKAALNATNAAATSVTENAQAVVTAVPKIPNAPDWFAPIQNDLITAQGNANDWLQRICPALNGVPNGIVNFNDTFQTDSGQILDVIQETADGGNPLTQDQRTTVESSLQDLSTQLDNQAQAIAALETDTKNYFTNINQDQDRLQNDLGTVSEKFAESQVWIQKLQAAMSETFLDSNVLGPCTVIVNIDMNLSFQLGNIGSDPTLNTLVIAKAILQNQINNYQTSQQAVQAILDLWTTLKSKNDAVLSDLKDARQDDQYIAILTKLDLETAQDQWQQLSDFASTLADGQNTSPENSMAMSQPAT